MANPKWPRRGAGRDVEIERSDYRVSESGVGENGEVVDLEADAGVDSKTGEVSRSESKCLAQASAGTAAGGERIRVKGESFFRFRLANSVESEFIPGMLTKC